MVTDGEGVKPELVKEESPQEILTNLQSSIFKQVANIVDAMESFNANPFLPSSFPCKLHVQGVCTFF